MTRRINQTSTSVQRSKRIGLFNCDSCPPNLACEKCRPAQFVGIVSRVADHVTQPTVHQHSRKSSSTTGINNDQSGHTNGEPVKTVVDLSMKLVHVHPDPNCVLPYPNCCIVPCLKSQQGSPAMHVRRRVRQIALPFRITIPRTATTRTYAVVQSVPIVQLRPLRALKLKSKFLTQQRSRCTLSTSLECYQSSWNHI